MKKRKGVKKKAVKKAKKKVVKKAVRKPKKKVVKKQKKIVVAAKEKAVKAGPSIPAGASLEEVGVVTHYFSKVNAAVVKMTKSSLSLGDTIFIKGHTSDFKEKVESIQLDHVPITTTEVGQEIGLKVKSKVREHDIVYKLIG